MALDNGLSCGDCSVLAWPPPHHPSLPVGFLVTLPIILCCLHSYNTWSWNPISQYEAGFSVLAQGSAHGLFIHSGYRERLPQEETFNSDSSCLLDSECHWGTQH